MIKVKNNNHIKRRRKVMRLTKGFRGRINNCYTLAKRSADKALTHNFISRKLSSRMRHRDHIMAINSYARANGSTYSKLMKRVAEYNSKNEIKFDREIIVNLLKRGIDFNALIG